MGKIMEEKELKWHLLAKLQKDGKRKATLPVNPKSETVSY